MNELFSIEQRQAAAELAGLRYVSDDEAGYVRQRWGQGFTYRDAAGDVVKDEEIRARFDALVIPPAWTDVWICKDDQGHLQVTGRDESGRKQSIYHAKWAEARARQKYERLQPFARALPALRERYDGDLRSRGLTKRKVSALAAALLDASHVRIGTDEYAEEYGSYGLTTLLKDQVYVGSEFIKLDFMGKSSKQQSIRVDSRRLANQLKKLMSLPSETVFCFEDDPGQLQQLTSQDVNEYIALAMNEGFSAKDFRTWGGTTVALAYLVSNPPNDEVTIEKRIVEAVDAAADHLGNTRAVARSSYIDPLIIEAAESGALWSEVDDRSVNEELASLTEDERRTLRILQRLSPKR